MLSYVSHPQLVGCSSCKRTFNQVGVRRTARISFGAACKPSAMHPDQICFLHQSVHPFFRTTDTVAQFEFGMNPRCIIGSVAFPVYSDDQGFKFAVFQRSFRIDPIAPGIKPAGGDTQHPAHDYNAMLGLRSLHKQIKYYRVLLFSLRVETCRFFLMSRSFLRILVSRRKRCSSSRSDVLNSSRSPVSISCCRIQLRIDSQVTPSSRATSDIFRSPSFTRRTASRLNSGGYGGFVFGIGEHLLSKSTPSIKVSTKPGQVQYLTLFELLTF